MGVYCAWLLLINPSCSLIIPSECSVIMVDPHSAAAGTNALLSVCIFIGSQISPSVMIRRAVKKELKVAALLKESGSIIGAEDWRRIDELQEKVLNSKRGVPQWGEVIKRPVKVFIKARQYHDATCTYLFEVRVASARATVEAARTAAMQNHVNEASAEGVTSADDTHTESGEEYPMSDAPLDETCPSYDYVLHIEDAFTTRFENVVVVAGARSQITLHFGVGDIPVTINPLDHFVDMPACYTG
ncbi:hypothetical protein L227DRAFT_658823, partial [Lentinus tigrinus ALCF2SS1-6]